MSIKVIHRSSSKLLQERAWPAPPFHSSCFSILYDRHRAWLFHPSLSLNARAWPPLPRLPSRTTRTSMSAPSVVAPMCAAATSRLPVPTNGSYTKLPRRTCKQQQGSHVDDYDSGGHDALQKH